MAGSCRRLVLAALGALAVGAPAAAAAPPAIFTATPTQGAAPLTVHLYASVPWTDPERAATFRWRFGDGAVEGGSSPVVSHRFARPGRYRVQLTVANALGGSRSAVVEITVRALSLRLSAAQVAFGAPVVAAGRLEPAVAGRRVLLERRLAGGGWRAVAAAATGAAGRFRTTLRPAASGTWRARLAGGSLRSEPAALDVAPRVAATATAGVPFRGVPIRLRVSPAWYGGRVSVTVLRGGRELAQAGGLLRGGRLEVLAPTPGLGRFTARVVVPPRAGLAGATLVLPLRVTAPTLSAGSRGREVLALRKRLAELRFHVPPPSDAFDSKLFDAVVAFQKARGLSRTGVVTTEVWEALAENGSPRARYPVPGSHIEVDKTRQILLKVLDGEVVGILPVSSGATGNTPVGRFRILWKAPSTTTWLGPAILYRTLTFYRGFAIHGFYSVPVYPASHGCVRVPIWAADWLYDRSPVGEAVYIYA